MEERFIMEFDWWSWIIIPMLIFAARLLDVSLATMRHILIFRGHRRIVPAIAFAEVLVWLVAITQVMNNLSNFASYLAWAGGFVNLPKLVPSKSRDFLG